MSETAVPRNLIAFTERSPGDTSPEAPEGTPSRGEASPRTRGDKGRRRDGGVAVDPATLPPEVIAQIADAQKVAYWEEREAKKKMRADADLEKKRQRDQQELQHALQQPVKLRDFAAFVQEIERRLMSLHDRIEAHNVALSAVGKDHPEHGRFVQALMEELPLAQQRIMGWRHTVREIESADFNFVDMRERVREWNAEAKNPRINIQCFQHEWLLRKFSQANPDATLTPEERREFGLELGIPEDKIDIVLQGVMNDPNKPLDKGADA